MNKKPLSNHRGCVVCEKKLVGRIDKVFCSSSCKNFYHSTFRKEKKTAGFVIDSILSRNYQIIAGLMPPGVFQIRISLLTLTKLGFDLQYTTHTDNQGNKYLYQFALNQSTKNGDEYLEIIISPSRIQHHPFVYERWAREVTPTRNQALKSKF